ncbi:MAG: DUF885 family protein, partial [Deltaproteobacteria bacterium]|nr:DUF885 family protein [Deltaproteobacteria bacterium]
MRKILFVSFLLALFSSSALATPYEDACARIAKGGGSDAKRLHQLFAEEWRWAQTEYPEDGTFNGYPGVNDRWTDESLAAIERRHRELEAPLKALKSIRRAALSSADKLNYDLFRRNAEEQLEGRRFPDELTPVHQLSGPQQLVP